MIRHGLLGLLAGAAMNASMAEPIRVASFNVSFYFTRGGELIETLESGEYEPARQAAAIIQRIRPDVLLLNEFDHDEDGTGIRLFRDQYLAVSQFGQPAIDYPYHFLAPSNTGLTSGVDLNGDGQIAAPQDAHGWGEYEGKYAMVVLSRLPIDEKATRTFQRFLWKDLPDPSWPRDPATGEHHYSEAARDVLRLSSKSHWDVAIQWGDRVLHLLASHPTPPVFDGPENRNGLRNFDEIRFWADYIDQAGYMTDDQGRQGGLAPGSPFVIAGDLNADPEDGDATGSIGQLLGHPAVNADFAPSSRGAVLAAEKQAGSNLRHRSDPAHDTGHFSAEGNGPGNLRLDYALPARSLSVSGSGVFWPAPDEPGREWLEASDHRLVWIDIQ